MNMEKIRKRFIPMSETMFYILLSLQEKRHGYGIMLHVKELTGGRIVLGAGTVYQSLRKLENDGLIIPEDATDRKKTYRITDAGRQILLEEARRIREMAAAVEGLL